MGELRELPREGAHQRSVLLTTDETRALVLKQGPGRCNTAFTAGGNGMQGGQPSNERQMGWFETGFYYIPNM